MECTIEERDGITVLSPRGDLDADAAADFRERVDALLDAGKHYFVVDLSEVDFVDSSGLASLVRLYKHVRIGEGDVRLAAVPKEIGQVLELTRLNRVFDIFPTVGEASATMKRSD